MTGPWQTSCQRHKQARRRGLDAAGSRAAGPGPGLQLFPPSKLWLQRISSRLPLRTSRPTSESANKA